MPETLMPSHVSKDVGVFDRFAGGVARQTARSPFFMGCVLLILLWPITFWLVSADTAQLIVNTATTIVTFLLVALLQNSQHRADAAVQHKLNAIADALGDLMCQSPGQERHVEELRSAVGLENRESSTD